MPSFRALGILIYEAVMGASAYGNEPGVDELVDGVIDVVSATKSFKNF